MTKGNNKIFEEIILDLLKNNPEKSMPFDVLQNVLQVSGKKDNQRLKNAINSLYDKNLIVKRKGGAIQLSPNGDRKRRKKRGDKNVVTGKLDMSRHGTGYLVTDERKEDIRVQPKQLGTALPDDKVRVEIFKGRGHGGRL
ncbi:MAG: hypothetical protein R3211_01585, partial [Balneolaceae bacterium]|nr:hypothetical protein [Balneolaceae bacterium]